MAEWQNINLPTTHNVARSSNASATRLVNMVVEQNPQGSKSPFTLYSRPGLLPWNDAIGDGPCRGLLTFDSYIYMVSGEELYRVDSFGVASLLGTIPGTSQVRMIRNNTQVAIATNTTLFVWDGAALVSMALSGFNGACYIDGYGIFTTSGDEKFYITATDDFTSMSALDFSSSDALPDILKGCLADRRELILFGADSVEWWYNSGNASFPFQRSGGGFCERGCESSGSIVKTGIGPMWLGNDFRVYLAQGYQAIPVSTASIEDEIKAQPDTSSCEASSFTMAGKTYYVLSFAAKTFAYDINSQSWSEWTSPSESRFRGQCSIVYNGLNIVGDFENGKLYELDHETYSDDGTAFERLIDFPTINGNGRRVIMEEFFLDAQVGVGLDGAGDSTDPMVEFLCSDDQGKTWSTARLAQLGGLGDYRTRPMWHGLGTFFNRIIRIRNQDAVMFAVSGAHVRMEAWE